MPGWLSIAILLIVAAYFLPSRYFYATVSRTDTLCGNLYGFSETVKQKYLDNYIPGNNCPELARPRNFAHLVLKTD